jgi:ABC-type Co2+ transport system permease subunit
MHIEPGILNGVKIGYANQAAIGTIAAYFPSLIKRPDLVIRTILAAIFFSVLMQSFHMPVGPSELHLVGVSAIYFLFGFIPTLLAFPLGLLLQGAIFEPADLIHIGVNSLSLMLPLIATHYAIGNRFIVSRAGQKREFNWQQVIHFDAVYYGGLVAMVGFWLLNGNEITPLQSWASFAITYLPLVLLEPVLTIGLVKLMRKVPQLAWLGRFTVVNTLQLQA